MLIFLVLLELFFIVVYLQNLTQVLAFLGNHDLLSCSLVNKSWYKVSRKILRDFRVCYADLRKNSCITLSSLLATIDTMTFPPFNGIRVKTHRENDPRYPCVGFEEALAKSAALKIRYLELEDRIDGKSCPLYKLIQNFCHTVQIVRDETLDSIFSYDRKKNTFIIVTRGEDIVPTFLKDCSNVQDIFVRVRLNEFWESLPPSQRQALRSLSLSEHFSVGMLNQTLKIAEEGGMKLVSLMILCDPHRIHGRMPEFMNLFNKLVQVNSERLLDLSIGLASILKPYGVPALKNLKRLTIFYPELSGVHSALTQRQVLRYLLRKINYEEELPSLKAVKIWWNFDVNYQYTPVEPEPGELLYSSATVTNLTFDGVSFGDSFQEWGEIFPNVKELKLRFVSQSFEQQCTTVWESYSCWGPTLEVVDIEKDHRQVEDNLTNYDALFAGLNQEEAVVLQELDPEILEKLNTVPARPGLTAFPRSI